MKKIQTNDGSYTFLNEEFGDVYNSQSGALEEAEKKFVRPSGILQLHEAHVLDVCFGLGYNTLCALKDMWPRNISVTAVENDVKVLEKIRELSLPQAYAKAHEEVLHCIDKKSSCITLYVEDFRTVLPLLKEMYDAIFFDPFAPSKCPGLWTKEVFQSCWNVLKPKGKLVTYSCASSVRRHLKNAGFKVVDGPCVGRRAPSTIAIKGCEQW